MKKILLASLLLLTVSQLSFGQTFIKHGKKLVQTKYKTARLIQNVSVSLDTAFAYDQLNIQASYVPIGFSGGSFHEITGTTLGFTLSKMTYKSEATVTITMDKDTIYTVSSKFGYGYGITVVNNIKTGKFGAGPTVVGVLDKFSAIAGIAFTDLTTFNGFFDNAMPFIGIATSIDNLRGFINNSTHVR